MSVSASNKMLNLSIASVTHCAGAQSAPSTPAAEAHVKRTASMRRFLILVITTPLLWSNIAFSVELSDQLVLRIESQVSEYEMKERLFVAGHHIHAEISNVGDRAVKLVQIGDGSEVQWRTPIISWTIEHQGESLPHDLGFRCANINSLEHGEVFLLSPGDSHELAHWIPYFKPPGPGSYKLTLVYENRPLLEWRGLGSHDQEEMNMVRESEACKLTSNTIEIVVREGPKEGSE